MVTFVTSFFFGNQYIFCMKDLQITKDQSLFDIITAHPETMSVFTSNGFSMLEDERQLNTLGKMLTLEAALIAKKKNPEVFLQLLSEIIEQQELMQEDGISRTQEETSLHIAGILPCPVKLPLTDSFKSFSEDAAYTASYELRSASGGISWIEDIFRAAEHPEDIPDLLISAGFELFFDKHLVGSFRDRGVFRDLCTLEDFNSCFSSIELKDPRGNYTIIGGVPAVFLVDTLVLGERAIPRTWEDLLSEQFTGSISLPVEDLDLFNAVLLTLFREKGAEAIRALGRNMAGSMHPAQMVSQKKQQIQPAVTILPWFFTRMVFEPSSLKVIWPEDGSILSPIFLAAKQEKAVELQEYVDHFTGIDAGRIMRERGYFPVIHPEIDNAIPEGRDFKFLGWDFIYEHDISEVIADCTRIFEDAAGGKL